VARGALTSADSLDAEDESLVRTGWDLSHDGASRPPSPPRCRSPPGTRPRGC